MHITKYISELLFRYDCVVVPNFGAFLAEKTSAKIDENTGEFYPPYKRISFNAQLKNNDGVLANHVSSIEEISYENALLKIKNQINLIKKSLENKTSFEIKNIGYLTKSKEGKIIFEPIKDINYLTASFGLTKFISPAINKEDKGNIKPKQIKFNSIKETSHIIQKYAASIFLSIGLISIVGSNIYNIHIKKYNTLSQREADNIIENQIQEATFIISDKLPALEIDLRDSFRDYHIVAGAFRIKKNSEKKLRELKRLGFKAKIIGKNRFGLYQVVFGSYYNQKKAEHELVKIRKSQDNSAWILKKRVL